MEIQKAKNSQDQKIKDTVKPLTLPDIKPYIHSVKQGVWSQGETDGGLGTAVHAQVLVMGLHGLVSCLLRTARSTPALT